MEMFMYNGKAPCYGCAERKPNCHGTCPKYIEWKNALQKKKDAAYMYYQGEDEVKRYQIKELVKGKIIKQRKER